MKNQLSIRQELLDDHLASLLRSFNRPRKDVSERELLQAFEQKRYADMVSEMKVLMDVGCRMRIGYVNSGGPEMAEAWIQRLPSFPLYGSPEFYRLHLTMYLSKTLLKNAPFASVVATMAHELAHVVLDMLHHPLRKSEEAVELTAMVLGFRSIYVRQNMYQRTIQGQTETVTSGYLTYAEVLYASMKIEAGL